jgi:hypothetical protein
MSPEQVEGAQKLDGRSDIYSLGVILFEMLTGKRPYESDTMMRLAMMHLLEPVPQLQEANPAVPLAYQGVINRAMAKKPADRYPTAAALTSAVMEIARPRPTAPVKPVKRGFFSGPFRQLLIAGGLMGGLVIIVALVAFIAYSMDLFPGGAVTPPDTSVPDTTLTDSAVVIQETDIANESTPAPATISASAATVPPEPSITPEPSDVYIQYVLDVSNSMLEAIDGGPTKLEVGRNALAEHWRGLQSQPNLGLRAFGHRFSAADQVSSCQDTELLAAPAQGQVESLISLLFGLQAQGLSPLAMALREVPGDFFNVPERTNAVILIADSGDNCGGDPCQTIRNQAQGGINYPIFVAGLGVEEADRESLICLAENSGGLYLDVADEASLIGALNSFVEELVSRP